MVTPAGGVQHRESTVLQQAQMGFSSPEGSLTYWGGCSRRQVYTMYWQHVTHKMLLENKFAYVLHVKEQQ